MEELLDRYLEVKRVLDSYTRKMKNVRAKMKQELGDISVFNNGLYKVELQKVKRLTMVKKETPDEIWQKYAIPIEYETLKIVEVKEKQKRKATLIVEK